MEDCIDVSASEGMCEAMRILDVYMLLWGEDLKVKYIFYHGAIVWVCLCI